MAKNDYLDLPNDKDEREHVSDELADLVMAHFRKACAYRSSHLVQGKSVDEWFRRLSNAYNKVHEQEELAARKQMQSYFGLIQSKINMSVSYMRSKFVSVERPPFNIFPTPIVDLPLNKQKQGLEKVKGELLNRMLSNGIPPEAVLGEDGFLLPQVAEFVTKQAEKTKEALRKEEYKIAEKATKKMARLIKDQLIEGQFSSAMAEAIFDLALYPTMVMSYELESVVDYVWRKNKYEKISTVRPTFRRVEPRNAFFAPNSTSAQDGAFFIELTKRSKSQLADLLEHEELGYFTEVVEDIIENGSNQWLGEAMELVELFNHKLADDEIHTLRCQTLIRGADLLEYGVDIKAKDAFKYFNADIEVCDSRVIRCALTPHPKGERTYFSASYKRIAGQAYGISIGMMIYDRQLSINRTQYAMMLNAAHAAGPAVEINADAFDNPWEVNLEPYTRFFSNPDRTDSSHFNGIKMHQVTPTFHNLFTFMTNEIRLADDECGLPSFLNGNAGLQGAGRTLGGIALMTDNAVLGLEDCAFNLDEYVIRPAITLIYARNLLGDDESVKSDAKVVATGLLGLRNELMKAKELAGLVPQVGQIAQSGAISPEIYKNVVADYLRSQGIEVDEIDAESGVERLSSPTGIMASPTEGLVDGRSV